MQFDGLDIILGVDETIGCNESGIILNIEICSLILSYNKAFSWTCQPCDNLQDWIGIFDALSVVAINFFVAIKDDAIENL